MIYNPEIHHRRSIRLPGYDYSQNGAYFITICTFEPEARHAGIRFGEIIDHEMVLNEFGRIARDEWLKTAEIREYVELDEFVGMPDHIHGIIVLHDMDGDCHGDTVGGGRDTIPGGRDTARRVPTVEQFGKPTIHSIPTIVRVYKSAVTKRINENRNTPAIVVWQRGYYEHVIRDEQSLQRVREYIQSNPIRWNK